MADPYVPSVARVERVRRETRDTWTLELAAPDAVRGFRPGQFNMLYAFAVGEIPVSVSGDADAPERLVHTVRAVGRVSEALARLRRGHTLALRGPYGTAWPVAEIEGADVVLAAGGLGLAPLRPALYHILARRERYGTVTLLYGTRSPEDILYRRELEGWRRRLDLEVLVTVDHAGGDWHGNVGVVTSLVARAGFDPPHTAALICGPEVMMRFTVSALRDAGVDPARMYVSMERNMKCAIAQCGHCQLGPHFVCREGAVFPYPRLARLFTLREI